VIIMNKTASKLASLAAASAIFAATSIASASVPPSAAGTVSGSVNPVVNPGTGAFEFTLHISWADPGSVSNPACRTVMGRTVCSR
jgi:hypothetical protein